jgi:hypothetical protein
LNAPRSRIRRRLAVLGAAVSMALLLGEVGARIVLAVLDARPRSLPTGGSHVGLVDMIQEARHPDVVYELRAGLDCQYEGAVVRTNADGFRGPARARSKLANGFRIVGLGDSVLFGWGVGYEASGIAQLERRLQAELPGRVVETIGTGVPGYNTAMQAAVLREKGVGFAPDVVLVDFVGNDFDLPNFLLEPTDWWRLDRCYLVDLVARIARRHNTDPLGPFVGAPQDARGDFESDPTRVPERYRHLVGPDSFRRALREILALGARHGFRVLVTCHSALRPEAARICADLGVPVVEQRARIDAWLRQNGHTQFVGSPLSVRAGDPHPSALVHGWWAEAVAARLGELGWLPR